MYANIRVMVASEHDAIRRLLRRVVRDEPGIEVAVEARNEVETAVRAREARPDIALVDFGLPHSTGLDSVRLSRISGLDTAQALSNEMPDTRVVLLTNLDTDTLTTRRLSSDTAVRLATGTNGGRRPLTLRELCFEGVGRHSPIFASVELKKRARPRKRISMGKAIAIGLASLVGAWMLTGLVLLGISLAAIVGR